MITKTICLLKASISAILLLAFQPAIFSQQKTGIFENESDVGAVLHSGSTNYNTANQEYVLSGSGTNIWGTHDEFHYTWKRMKGNFILQTKAALIGKGVDPHRKFGWMIRTSLDSTAPMVSATVHGDGLTSLQYRKAEKGNVEETKFSTSAPDVIQLERKDGKYIMSVAHFGEPFVTEQVTDVNLGDDVYVGIFVCAHNKDVVEKATFNNVRIIVPIKENFVPYREYIGSNIEIMDVQNGNRQIIYTDPGSIQAPNWTKDNKALIYNTNKGLMYRFDLATKTPSVINTGDVKNNNNDHVISFDGKMLGLSSGVSELGGSIVYTVPLTGGTPKQITPRGPSYLHGWSPDDKFLVFTGQRNNEFDIYKVPSKGGPEVRLTTIKGLDDGPEYSPDGKYIYFNSVRTGLMQLWRMKQDGSNQEQLTFDEYNNWFPHISPDGKWIAFVSFMKDINPNDHPFYRHVYLRLMPVNGGKPKVIAYLYGGQGSMNTPSWSPDSKKIAFVSNSDVTNQ